MSQYSLIEEVALKQLSSKALIHLSRLSRLIKKNTGHVINLQDPLLMKKLAQHVRLSVDPTIQDAFSNLLTEIGSKTAQRTHSSKRPTSSLTPPRIKHRAKRSNVTTSSDVFIYSEMPQAKAS